MGPGHARPEVSGSDLDRLQKRGLWRLPKGGNRSIEKARRSTRLIPFLPGCVFASDILCYLRYEVLCARSHEEPGQDDDWE